VDMQNKLGFTKRKLLIKSPVNGNLVDLTEVPDPVFSERLVGDGVAIDPTGNVIAITTFGGIELMLHVGIDTVNLNGAGFELFVREGQKVKVGDELLRVDLDYLKSRVKSLISPIIIINLEKVKKMGKSTGAAIAKETDIFTVEY
jgi:sugar PTS system EIIA component